MERRSAAFSFPASVAHLVAALGASTPCAASFPRSRSPGAGTRELAASWPSARSGDKYARGINAGYWLVDEVMRRRRQFRRAR